MKAVTRWFLKVDNYSERTSNVIHALLQEAKSKTFWTESHQVVTAASVSLLHEDVAFVFEKRLEELFSCSSEINKTEILSWGDQTFPYDNLHARVSTMSLGQMVRNCHRACAAKCYGRTSKSSVLRVLMTPVWWFMMKQRSSFPLMMV